MGRLDQPSYQALAGRNLREDQVALDRDRPDLVIDQVSTELFCQGPGVSYGCREVDELSLGKREPQPCDQARQPMTSLGLFEHVNLVYDHGSDLAEASTGPQNLVYALVGPNDDVRVQVLPHLLSTAQLYPAHANLDGRAQTKLTVGR